MFRTNAATNAAAAVLVAVAAPAWAGGWTGNNGTSSSGIVANGAGAAMGAFRIDGIVLPPDAR